MISIIKSLTAREIFKRVPTVNKPLWGGELWSKGTCISAGGRPGSEEVSRQYVSNQGTEQDDKRLHSEEIQLERV